MGSTKAPPSASSRPVPRPARIAAHSIPLETGSSIDDSDTAGSLTAVCESGSQPPPTPMSISSSGQAFVPSPTPMSLCSQPVAPPTYPSQMSICESTVASPSGSAWSYKVEPVESHGSFEMSGSYSSFRSKVFKRRQELGLSPSTSMYGSISSIQEEGFEVPTRARSDSIISNASWATTTSIDSQQSGATTGSGYGECISRYDSDEDTIDAALADMRELEATTAALQLESRNDHNNTCSVWGSSGRGYGTKVSYKPPLVTSEEDEDMYTGTFTIKKPSVAQPRLGGELNTRLDVSTATVAATSGPARTFSNDQPPVTPQSRVKQIREQLLRYQEQQVLKELDTRQELTTHINNIRDGQLPMASPPRRGPIPQAARASFVERSKIADIRAAPLKRNQGTVNLPRIADEKSEMMRDLTQRMPTASGSRRDKGKGIAPRLEGANPRITNPNTREAIPMEPVDPFNTTTLNRINPPNSFCSPLNQASKMAAVPPSRSHQMTVSSSVEFVSQSEWLRAFCENTPTASEASASSTVTSPAPPPTEPASRAIYQASGPYPWSSDAQLFREKLLHENNESMVAILTQHCKNKINLYSAERIALEKSLSGATPASHPNHPYLMYSNGSGLAFVDEMKRAVGNVRQLCDQQLELVRQMETHYLVGNMNFGVIVPQTAGRKRSGDESGIVSYQSEQYPENTTIHDSVTRTYGIGDDGSSADGRRVRSSTIKQRGQWNSHMYGEASSAGGELTDEDEQPPLDVETSINDGKYGLQA